MKKKKNRILHFWPATRKGAGVAQWSAGLAPLMGTAISETIRETFKVRPGGIKETPRARAEEPRAVLAGRAQVRGQFWRDVPRSVISLKYSSVTSVVRRVISLATEGVLQLIELIVLVLVHILPYLRWSSSSALLKVEMVL